MIHNCIQVEQYLVIGWVTNKYNFSNSEKGLVWFFKISDLIKHTTINFYFYLFEYKKLV